MKNRRLSFYVSIIVLIIWVINSWVKGPTQKSIDAKFKTTETTLDNIQYIVEYYPAGLLVSGKLFGDGEYVKRVELKSFSFSMNGIRGQEVRESIASYYKPYMNSVIDTLDEYNLEIQQAAIDQILFDMPKDTAFSSYHDSIKIEKDIWPSKKVVFSYNNNTKYVELSLMAFEDINKKFKGAAPQDYDRFTEVSNRAHQLFTGKLKAKILLADTFRSMPIIYELIDENGNTVMADDYSFDLLKTDGYEDTEFMIWYLRDGFLTTTFFILFFMSLAYFVKKR